MKVRTVSPRAGGSGWVWHSASHPLPPGLPDRSAVSIVSTNLPLVTVRDGTGKEWQIIRWQLDCGAYYRTPAGKWMHESKPRALTAIYNGLRRHLETLQSRGGPQWDEKAARLRWILQRNGLDPAGVDEPSPFGPL